RGKVDFEVLTAARISCSPGVSTHPLSHCLDNGFGEELNSVSQRGIILKSLVPSDAISEWIESHAEIERYGAIPRPPAEFAGAASRRCSNVIHRRAGISGRLQESHPHG